MDSNIAVLVHGGAVVWIDDHRGDRSLDNDRTGELVARLHPGKIVDARGNEFPRLFEINRTLRFECPGAIRSVQRLGLDIGLLQQTVGSEPKGKDFFSRFAIARSVAVIVAVPGANGTLSS